MQYNPSKGGIRTRNQNTKAIALCGVTAALAITLGALGGMIPVATYVIPVLQCIVLQIVLRACGRRFAWTWYGAVTILNFLLCPDKEAAAMFAFLGYYPIIKPGLDRVRLSWLWKLMFFLLSTGVMYSVVIFLFGMDRIALEFRELGIGLGVLCLVLGSITFLMLDKILSRLKL